MGVTSPVRGMPLTRSATKARSGDSVYFNRKSRRPKFIFLAASFVASEAWTRALILANLALRFDRKFLILCRSVFILGAGLVQVLRVLAGSCAPWVQKYSKRSTRLARARCAHGSVIIGISRGSSAFG